MESFANAFLCEAVAYSCTFLPVSDAYMFVTMSACMIILKVSTNESSFPPPAFPWTCRHTRCPCA